MKPDQTRDQYLFQGNVDIDVMYALFKYRPATASLPRQVTNSFNANVFAGYRLDRFHMKFRRTHSGTPLYKLHHRSVGIGIFGGLGAATVATWTTQYRTTDDYYGLTISRGVMVIGGIDALTVGISLGFDRLKDRDKNIWIYQDKPWYGLTLGVNIN